jgi:(1->4)-alpha-D-glucan 1-alpha-D-glucosylmutase
MWKFIGAVLRLEYPDSFGDADRSAILNFVGKFQQLTAPVMAKGAEDTAFYVYNRLVSLNEVGGDPGRFGESPEAVHQWLRDRQQNWAGSLSPLSTHDTKRSEDVRARIDVLSEMADEWWQCVARWRLLNGALRRSANGSAAPDSNDEYLIYQTLIGAWPMDLADSMVKPDFVRRIQEYTLKAIREAKVNSSWTEPNSEYENRVADFIADVLSAEKSGAFLRDLRLLQRHVSELGRFNSMSQTLLRLTAPGVPDSYQGAELWDLSLVDPDNRRQIDYERRRNCLANLIHRFDETPVLARELLKSSEDGWVKLFLTWRALDARSKHPKLFSSGEYLPVEVKGPRHENLFSFLRHENGNWALAVVPRLTASLRPLGKLPIGDEIWAGTELIFPSEAQKTEWKDQLTGSRFMPAANIKASAILADFPAALLLSGGL